MDKNARINWEIEINRYKYPYLLHALAECAILLDAGHLHAREHAAALAEQNQTPRQLRRL